MELKDGVKEFWDEASCGEKLLLENTNKIGYLKQSAERYALEPIIESFAEFDKFSGKNTLEIGVGLGADHQRYAESGALLSGIDLTNRAVEHTLTRLSYFGLESDLRVGDAENIDFRDNTFDLVYSWGVIHHSPNTPEAVSEIFRILKPGGRAKIMIYHKWSIVGFMLWFRYGLLALNPRLSLADVYSQQLESPGTKAYSISEAYALFDDYSDVRITTLLTHADLLTSQAGQRHEGFLLTLARKIWPRRFLKFAFSRAGLFMLIDARKG